MGASHEDILMKKMCELDELQSACTKCGLCLESCATFQTFGWEHESPRGRLNLANQFLNGRILPQSHALSTFDRCLGCRACEAVCPHQVSYHKVRELVQELRIELDVANQTSLSLREYKQWIRLAQRIGSVWWRRYGSRWIGISTLTNKKIKGYSKEKKIYAETNETLAVCCLQDLLHHELIDDTLRFMNLLGLNLRLDKNQPCCGALFERLVNGGVESVCFAKERKIAASYQEKRAKQFNNWITDGTYFLARGCQSFSQRSSKKGKDLYSRIEAILEEKKIHLYLSERRVVYYQPYCGWELRESDSIWRVLHRVEGLKVYYLENPRSCCGGYCGNAILYPEQAKLIVREKIKNLPNKATIIVTSPDCLSAFEGNDCELLHPMTLLAQTKMRS